MKTKLIVKSAGKLKVTRNRTRRKVNFCSECQTQFINNSLFKLHINLAHMPEIKMIKKSEYTPIIFPCSHCTERFSSIITYEMHFKYCHAEILLKKEIYKFECQQVVVNSLKLEICKMKQKETERERHISFLTDNHARVVRDLTNKIEDWESSQKCKICTATQINTAFMPCGHCISCNECAHHKDIKECPICRGEIFTTMHIKL